MTPSTLDLSAVGPGFADAVHGAQRSFRAVLEALARPGRLQTVDRSLCQPAPCLGLAATACLMTLLDAEVSLWLSPALQAAGPHLRFHTGVRLIDTPEAADFAVASAAEADPALWQRLRCGTDAQPEDGATWLIDGAGLRADGGGLRLQGPGIESHHRLHVTALAPAFWTARAALAPAYPCGIDLLLCEGSALAGLPRTTHVSMED